MLFHIPNYGWLKVKSGERESIVSQTGQAAFVKSHFSDIRKECSALKAICERLHNIKTIADAMAGCGFSAAVLRTVYPGCELILNDWDERCYENLLTNFKHSQITKEDINKWQPKKKVDLLFIDFNNFTLKRISDWKETILRLNKVCKNLLITDSACFGFRMGNLTSYNVKTPTDYYLLLEKELGLEGKELTHFCMFGNAALVLFESRRTSEPKELNYRLLNIIRSEGVSLWS